MKAPNIVEYLTGSHFLGLTVSMPQETLLRAAYGLPLSPEQAETFCLCTGRESYVARNYSELTVLVGARGGKDSRIACPIGSYEAVFGGHHKHLARGERGVIPLVAPGQMGTAIAFGYIKSHFENSRVLNSMVEDITANEIKLTNRISVICFPCTKSSLRGWSIPAAIEDEPAFYRLEGSAESDVEVQASIRRGMIGFSHTRLIKISTPYMKSGIMYDDFKNYYGKDSEDVLVWKAPSILMNPTLKAERLEREKRMDPQRYMREYEAEFAEDLDAFLPSAWVESAISPGRRELPPSAGFSHCAAVDTSGLGTGANADAFTLTICHNEQGRIVQDVCRGWRKSRTNTVDLSGIVGEIARMLRSYRLTEVMGDRYAAQWVVEAFRQEGVFYHQTDRDKSVYYLELEPLFAQGAIELLDHPQQERELKLLERRLRPGGKVLVDHPRSGHDDYANSLAIAAVKAKAAAGLDSALEAFRSQVGADEDPDDDIQRSPFGSSMRQPWGIYLKRGGLR